MKKKGWVACLLCVFLLLSGCRHNKPMRNWSVLSKIAVTWDYGGNHSHKVFIRSDKIRQILNCIRSLGQKSTPVTNPEFIDACTYTITLIHTDGSQHIYRTKDDRYIQDGFRFWQEVHNDKILELNYLLQTLPSDSHF